MAFPIFGDENAQEGLLLVMLRAAGVICTTANEAGTGGQTDESQLTYAAERGLAILTHDIGDFQRLHTQWAGRGQNHAGILIVTDPYMPARTLCSSLVRLQAARSPEEMINAILFIRRPTAEERP